MRFKVKKVHDKPGNYSLPEKAMVERAINKVLTLRKISDSKQVYEQLAQIKKYILDSYEFG